MKFTKLENKLINFFYTLEMNRKNKESAKNLQDNILPKYVLKRHIKIITNGKVVFDSNDYKGKNIPISVQYTIKQYGYPKTIKSTNKTPLVYNITSVASSIFSSEEQQNRCLQSIKR